MIFAIVKGFLICVALMFGFVAFFKAAHGERVDSAQNAIWAVALSTFITLQWLLP